MSLRRRLGNYRRGLAKAARDPDRPDASRLSWLHFLFFDHGILRIFWHNFAQIAPGVYRANQPSPARLEHYARMGFRTILNLRGQTRSPPYRFELETCARLGLSLVNLDGLAARRAPQAVDLLALIEAMRQAERPFLLHCKSGADRSALAAAIYLLVFENAPVAEARRQFSLRYVHLKWTKAGVLDQVLDSYAAAQAKAGIPFEDWLRNGYDAATVQAEFEADRQ